MSEDEWVKLLNECTVDRKLELGLCQVHTVDKIFTWWDLDFSC